MLAKALCLAVIPFVLTPDSPIGEPLPITLHVRVELAEKVVEQLRTEVERIYSPADICIDWSSDNESRIHVFIDARPERKVITGCSRNLHDHRLGRVALTSRRITLWTEQTARGVAGDWDSREPPIVPDLKLGRALGRVLAHELGHLLLALNGHRSEGLMRANFKHRDLSGNRSRPFRLSSRDTERLREGVRVVLAQK
jgi:hypothetical protein